jgi:tetratricopeptide (TPR) repeat protein/tRNA A-37 threonylcarbamoyl transferase component Bud32
MAAFSDRLSIGEIVGNNYEILGIVGAGGMGVVYRARDRKLARIVALKFLPPDMDRNERERDYFLLEARTASSLDHPNIGVIHGIEETADGRSFIVMAFYQGQSLAQKMSAGPLSINQAVDIACQIALGLKEAHARKIVHRDIKPSNVMIPPSGVVKIVDFGLARVITAETATVTGVTGTVKYMSPEQAMGQRVDERTDVWSLGVILAEMLTGGNPFERTTVSAILVAVLHQAPQNLDGIPVAMQRIIYRALSKNPETRYQSCVPMLADLEALRANLASDPATNREGSKAKTTGRSGDLRKYVEEASKSTWGGPARKRNKWLPWVLSGAGTLVAIGFFLSPELRERIRITSVGAAEKHIAVLPFETSGKNPEDAALVEGLLDSLAGKLSNLDVDNKALWVIPTSEIRRLKVTDPSTALKDFGANYVVSGSVHRDGKAVNLSLNLIDTKNLRLVGAADIDDQGGDLATLEERAVSRLAKLMDLSVHSGTMKNEGGTAAPAAYEDYLTSLGYIQRYDKPGNLDRAVASLQNAINTDPNFALGRAELGEAYRFKYIVDQNPRWLNEAEANARKAVELDSQLPAAYVTLGWVHDATGKYDLALQEFQQALHLEPLNGLAMAGLARSYNRSGRIADAEATYQRAIALRNNDWDAYNNYAQFSQARGKYAQAITQYQKALQLTPDNAQVLANLGAAYLDTGDSKQYPVAEQSLQRSIAIAPSYEAYANLGYLYVLELRFQESATESEKALKLNDKNYDVWGNLLVCYEWLKLPEKAAEARRHLMVLLEQVVRVDPNNANAHVTLSIVYAAEHEREKSLSNVQTALALAPDNPDTLLSAADAYEILGDRRQAVRYLQRGLIHGLKEDALRVDFDIQGVLKDPALRSAAKR